MSETGKLPIPTSWIPEPSSTKKRTCSFDVSPRRLKVYPAEQLIATTACNMRVCGSNPTLRTSSHQLTQLVCPSRFGAELNELRSAWSCFNSGLDGPGFL